MTKHAALLLTLLALSQAQADPLPEASVQGVYARVMAAGAAHARAQGWSADGAVWSFEHPSLDVYTDSDPRIGSHSYNGGAWVTSGALEALAALPPASQEAALAFALARQVANKSDLDDGKSLDVHGVAIYARLGLPAPTREALEAAIAILDETRIAALGPSHGIEFFFSGLRRKARALKVRRRYGTASAQRRRYEDLLDDAQVPAAGMVGALPS